MAAALPGNELERLAALHRYSVLDSAPDEELDNLVRLVARVCGVPIAAISIVDENRQWFKSITGLDATETSRDVAFCAHTILQTNMMVVADAQADPRFSENALVTGAPHIRFYAGMPLITSEGYALGSLCVIDRTPRHLTPDQEEILRLLSKQVANQLEAAHRVAVMERLMAAQERMADERERLIAEKERLVIERERAEAERRRDNEALQVEREFTRALLESLQEGIIACDANGTLTLFNRTSREFHGLSEQPLPPEQWAEQFDLYYADGVTRMNTQDIPLYRAFQGEVVRDVEHVVAPKCGSPRTVLANGRALYDAKGEKLGAVVAVNDVTERRQAERELARLAAIVESSEEAVMGATLDGTFVFWNKAAERLYGYAASEMIGRHVSYLAPPGERSPVPAIITRLVRGEAVETISVTRSRRDGTQFHATLSFSPIRDAAGKIVGVSCIARDVTERKKAEDALAETHAALAASEERFRTSVDAMEEGLALQDSAGAVIFCNASAERILGLSADQMRGRTSTDPRWRAVREDGTDFPGEQHPAMVALRECAPQRNVVMGIHKPNGDLTWMNISAMPLLHTVKEDGWERREAHGVVVTFADITERLRQEEQVRQSNAALLESETRLRRLSDAAFEGIIVSQSGVLVEVNKSLAAKFGYNASSDMLGLPTASLPSPESLDLVMQKIAAGDEDPYEVVLLRRDGTTFLAEVRGQATTFNGKPARVTAVRDISERRALERELREREARLRAILESAPVILYAVDADGIVTLSEGTGLAALGLKPGEAVGRSVYEFSGGDAASEENARRALAGEAISHDTKAQDLWLHTELSPMLGPDGASAGYIGVCFDITERVASEERFRVLFEASSDPHLLLGAEGVIDCNAAMVALFGCNAKSEMLSLHPAVMSPEFQPDGRLSRAKKLEMDALAYEHGFHRFEWMLRKNDGAEFPAEVTLTPVTLGGRSVLLSVVHDLTERKQQEQNLKDYAIVLQFQKEELERANAELEALATTDGLTGLKNHRAFQERLTEEVSRTARYGPPLSVILLDVDTFKQYNDTYGHPAGDVVLKAVGRILQECARDTDIAARYGGEEFVVILPQTDLAGATVFAERLRAAVEDHAWPLRAVTASFGVASLRLGEETGAHLIERADAALYCSKKAGRNRVSCDHDGLEAFTAFSEIEASV